jgi:exopolysaccharide biosynthesis protein
VKTNRKWLNLKKISIFLIFEIVFTTLTFPFLIFYGPFENIKKIIVGSAMNTFSHQYIATFFLSDNAIQKILGDTQETVDLPTNDNITKTTFDKNSFSDKIELLNIDGGSFNGKLMIIHDPTKVTVGYSSQIPSIGETTSNIAKNNNAIAAINAGGFTDLNWTSTGGTPMGFVIHKGQVIYNQMKDENIKQDAIAFTKNGVMIVGKYSIKYLLNIGVKEGVTFTPPLIVNEKPLIKGDGAWGIAPRTAIAQRKDGAVMFLVIDGRSIKTFGATLRDVQEIFLNQNAITAANLDGGSSTTMYYNGKIINRPSDALGERSVPTVFMVPND